MSPRLAPRITDQFDPDVCRLPHNRRRERNDLQQPPLNFSE